MKAPPTDQRAAQGAVYGDGPWPGGGGGPSGRDGRTEGVVLLLDVGGNELFTQRPTGRFTTWSGNIKNGISNIN